MFLFSNLVSIQNINYGEHILKSIIATKYAKSKLTVLLMLIITSVVRIHLVTFLTILLSYSTYVDFFTQIILSIIAVLHTNRIYKCVEYWRVHFYNLTRYIINNYTPSRYRKWKRNVTLCICLYIILIFSCFEITSNLVIMYTIQYMISYGIVDVIEQRKIERLIQSYKDRPKRVIYAELNVIDEFYKKPEIDKFFLDDKSYERIEKPKNPDKKLSDSRGKIGFVIIDDYLKEK